MKHAVAINSLAEATPCINGEGELCSNSEYPVPLVTLIASPIHALNITRPLIMHEHCYAHTLNTIICIDFYHIHFEDIYILKIYHTTKKKVLGHCFALKG